MPVLYPLADIAIWLAALLVVLAAYALYEGLLKGLVGRVPLIGGVLSSVLSFVITDAVSWTLTQFKSAIGSLAGLFMTPVHWLASLYASIIVRLYNLATAAAHITNVLLPDLESSLTLLITNDIHAAESYALTLTTDAESYALALDQQVYSYISAQLSQVYTFVDTQIAATDQFVVTGLSGAEAYALQLYHDAITYTQAGLTSAEGYAASLVTGAIDYTTSAVTGLDTSITADLGQLTSWVESQLTALQQYIAASVAGALATALAATQVVADDLQALKTDCTDNLCDNLGPLADLLSALSSLWGIGALVALGAEFATDPGGAARDVQDVLGDVVDGTVTVIRDAVGV